ncbi:General substrate transporter:major facilitator superfamily protein [Erwinia tracheiphila PSU-1]|nr:General substrate transporter:major facilitator superfamily protein [Erwinia tracheiphila PSU-1]
MSSLLLILVIMFVMMPLTLLWGHWNDRLGRRPGGNSYLFHWLDACHTAALFATDICYSTLAMDFNLSVSLPLLGGITPLVTA